MAVIKSYKEPVEKVRLPKEIEGRAKLGGKSNFSVKQNISDFDRNPVDVNGDRGTVPDHCIKNFALGVVDPQVGRGLRKKNGHTGSAVHARLRFERALRAVQLNINQGIKVAFVSFVRKMKRFFHRLNKGTVWMNSSGPGTGSDNGTELGKAWRALRTASFPVKIWPLLITILWWENCSTNSAKFVATNLSLSLMVLIFLIIAVSFSKCFYDSMIPADRQGRFLATGSAGSDSATR